MNLDIYSGCTVVESGTGSGCFSNSLARAVYPHGHVHTFEYNSSRAKQAEEEFQRLGLSDIVSVQCRDVCAKYDHEGGGFAGVPFGSVDAVFLDLPEPWLAVGHALDVLKPGRNLCTYSPCIEQVIRTCEELRKVGFHSIHMYEVRHRPFDGRSMTFENANLGRGGVNGSASGGGVVIASNSTSCNTFGSTEKPTSSGLASSAVKLQGKESKELDHANECNEGDDDNDDGDIIDNNKRRKLSTVAVSNQTATATESSSKDDINGSGSANNNNNNNIHSTWRPKREEDHIPAEKFVSRIIPPVQLRVARPMASMQGHTAFLTFALAPTERM